MISLEFAPYFEPLFLFFIFCMTMAMKSRYQYNSATSIITNRYADNWMIFFSIAFVIIIGLRPITAKYFGDTGNYGEVFEIMKGGLSPSREEGEWLWNISMWLFANTFGNYNLFLTVVAFLYQFATLRACKKIMPGNYSAAMVFCMGAFSFYSYGTNGIRNGLSLSLLLLAFAYVLEERTSSYIKAAALSIIAFNMHHSSFLPIACMIAARYYKNIKMIFAFWVSSIIISLVFGNALIEVFTNLGFDDRMNSYTDTSQYAGDGYNFGFRWDFLLYSVMPIWLGYYTIFKRKVYDKNYLFLLSTYMLANSFWIMVIRATFSNRFAYLSWFMYPLVIAYPLLKLDIYGEKQGRVLTNILFLHTAFTIFMNVVYYGLLKLGH